MELVRWTADFFKQHEVPQARLDAEILLAHVLGGSRMDLYMAFDKPLGEAERARYRELVRRRAKERVPVAYLTERREFWSLPFRVTPDVLIPRPETETLVKVALDLKPRRALELGVGSGCISGGAAARAAVARGRGVSTSRPRRSSWRARTWRRWASLDRVHARPGATACARSRAPSTWWSRTRPTSRPRRARRPRARAPPRAARSRSTAGPTAST